MRRLSHLMALLLSIICQQAMADTVSFSGSVDNVNDPNGYLFSMLGLTAVQGNSFTASYTLDQATLGSGHFNQGGEKVYPFSQFGAQNSIDIAGQVFSNLSTLYIGKSDNTWSISSYLFGHNTTTSIGLRIYFLDTNGDQTIPDTNTSFENWEYAGFEINHITPYAGTVTTLVSSEVAVSEVPLPGALVLMISSLLSLVSARYFSSK